MSHTPTPWELVEATEHHGPYICSPWGSTLCDLYAMSDPSLPSTRNGGSSKPIPFLDADANAAFIVKACNTHDDLVDVAKALRQHLGLFCGPDDAIANEIFRIADGAIAKAEGRS